MKFNIALLTLVCLVALIAGCKKANPMTGNWVFQVGEQYRAQIGDKVTVKVEFKDNETFSGSVHAINQDVQMEGTYKLEGKTLTMVTTRAGSQTGAKTETATLSDDGKSFEMPQFRGYGSMVKQ